MLGKNDDRARAVLLISDGEIHGPDLLTAAKQLRAQDIPLYTLGVGPVAGGPVPAADDHLLRDDDKVVMSRMDTTRLTEMAKAGGGNYFNLRADGGLWPDLIAQLRARLPAKSYYTSVSTPQHIEIFPWLLGATLLLFLWSGARQYSGLAIVALLPGLLHTPMADAAPWDEQQAYQAYTLGNYDYAERLYKQSDTYTSLMGLGAAAFRGQHWDTAISSYTRATQAARSPDEQASAHYNLGNALARLGRYDEAGRFYENALG